MNDQAPLAVEDWVAPHFQGPRLPTPKLDAALAEAKGKLNGIPFDRKGAYADYTTINQIRLILNPILAGVGVSFRLLHQTVSRDGDFALLHRTYVCSHSSGESEVVQIDWPIAKGRNAQEDVGKAATYSQRYVLRDYFELPLGHEADPDEPENHVPAKDQPKQRQKPKTKKASPHPQAGREGLKLPGDDRPMRGGKPPSFAPPERGAADGYRNHSSQGPLGVTKEQKEANSAAQQDKKEAAWKKGIALWDKLRDEDQRINGESRFLLARDDPREFKAFMAWATDRVDSYTRGGPRKGGGDSDLF